VPVQVSVALVSVSPALFVQAFFAPSPAAEAAVFLLAVLALLATVAFQARLHLWLAGATFGLFAR
jgi:hypothetical protein